MDNTDVKFSSTIPEKIDVEIPENVKEFLGRRYSVLVLSVNTVDALNGYGRLCFNAAEIKILTDRCQRCGKINAFRDCYTSPVSETHRHSWIQEYHGLCHGQGKDLQEAVDELSDGLEKAKIRLW